jgi:hypothetical protein
LIGSFPCHMTVQTFFRRLADRIPGAMQTGLVPGQMTAEEAAIPIALKDRLARLTADPVIIADSFGVVAKHRSRVEILAYPMSIKLPLPVSSRCRAKILVVPCAQKRYCLVDPAYSVDGN